MHHKLVLLSFLNSCSNQLPFWKKNRWPQPDTASLPGSKCRWCRQRRLDSGLQHQIVDSACSRTPVVCDCCWLSLCISSDVWTARRLPASGFELSSDQLGNPTHSALLQSCGCRSYDCWISLCLEPFQVFPRDIVFQNNCQCAGYNHSRRYDLHPWVGTSSQLGRSSSFGWWTNISLRFFREKDRRFL